MNRPRQFALSTVVASLYALLPARDLARLWADRGQPRKAHNLLAPIYSWLTEGFNTADLKDAKALLEEFA